LFSRMIWTIFFLHFSGVHVFSFCLEATIEWCMQASSPIYESLPDLSWSWYVMMTCQTSLLWPHGLHLLPDGSVTSMSPISTSQLSPVSFFFTLFRGLEGWRGWSNPQSTMVKCTNVPTT
jgi:hypothetical protein